MVAVNTLKECSDRGCFLCVEAVVSCFVCSFRVGCWFSCEGAGGCLVVSGVL
jgi:hypothetical protein